MKSKFGLDLPWGIYASILSIVSIATFIWMKIEPKEIKELMYYLSLWFIYSTLQGAILIRKGNLDIYKNILNAIWNIETTATFLYGVYIALDYPNHSQDMTTPFLEWANENAHGFVLMVIFFSIIAVTRAGHSVAEIFKSPIIKSYPLKKTSPSVTLKKSANNRSIKKKKK